MSTGKHLQAHAGADRADRGDVQSFTQKVPWFTRDGREVRCSRTRGWKLIKGGNPDLIELEWMRQTKDSSGGHPWESSLGYDIHQDCWIFDSRKRRLVWLPHSWRVDERYRI